MAIRSVLLNVSDISRSVDFYSRFLGAVVLGTPSDDEATLDLVTATIRLARLAEGSTSTFSDDDLQTGFRHVGFKVAEVDPLVARLKAAGVPFHLDPIDAEGGVRISFFYDPDGTLLEVVEGPLQYHEVVDQVAVQADWALGVPERARFDHVAETVRDLAVTSDYYRPFGFTLMAGIHQPSDPRGYEINFLRSGDTSLEIFTYDRAEKQSRAPQLDAPGFVAMVLDTAEPEGEPVGFAAGTAVVADPDGLLHLSAAAR